MKPEIVKATEEHCHLMAPHLRQIDIDEAWAIAAFKPLEALLYSVQDSAESWTVMFPDSDIPAFIFGIGRPGQILDSKRCVWLLGTPQIKRVSKQFIMESGDHLTMLAHGQTVYNYVLEGNSASLRWLKLLGFTIMEPKPYGWLNKPFHYVKKVFPPCVPLQQQH